MTRYDYTVRTDSTGGTGMDQHAMEDEGLARVNSHEGRAHEVAATH